MIDMYEDKKHEMKIEGETIEVNVLTSEEMDALLDKVEEEVNN